MLSTEHGTLYQLQNVINRTNVVKKPLDNFNACDDFLVLVVKCHILTAAIKMLKMGDVPSIADTENVWMLPSEECCITQSLISSTHSHIQSLMKPLDQCKHKETKSICMLSCCSVSASSISMP